MLSATGCVHGPASGLLAVPVKGRDVSFFDTIEIQHVDVPELFSDHNGDTNK